MFAEIVAIPPDAPDTMRPGARFTLREEAPLRVGRSSRCRLQVDVPAGQDLLVGIRHGSPHAWTEVGLPIPVSLSGRTIDMEVSYPLVDGDHLVFSTGLVLAVREQPLVVARDERLELGLTDSPDDANALAVYLDFLEERGDPLRRWLTSEHRSVEAERFFMLGPLSESARTQAVQTTFDARGFLSHVTIARHALVGTPGLFWHLELLAHLPVARVLEHLTIELFVGTAAKTVVAPRGTPGWPKSPPADLVIAHALDVLARASFAKTLRTLSFGVGTVDGELPAVPAGAFPRLLDRPLVSSPMRAQLTLVSEPVEGLLAPASVGWTFALTSEVRVGSDERAHLRLRDSAAPPLACRFVRRDEGWLVLADAADAETHHPRLRVNGRETTRRVLSAGDEVEPVPGLVLRFSLLPR
ncbi:MAG: FHA domain-containing protein [Myxococcaceae bacterium]|nr:FHA domain-containing protein [Myxococcaceae bacterium]